MDNFGLPLLVLSIGMITYTYPVLSKEPLGGVGYLVIVLTSVSGPFAFLLVKEFYIHLRDKNKNDD